MSKLTKIIIITIVILLGGVFFFFWSGYDGVSDTAESSQESDSVPVENNTMLGGDRDEHGCIGSAGYTWCEPKEKCLRIWEEECYENLEQEIEYLLAEKHNTSAEDVHVTIDKQYEKHASGSVSFGEGGVGEKGMFLAAEIDNIWSVLFDGNGSVDCEQMRLQYGFPDEILQPNFCD